MGYMFMAPPINPQGNRALGGGLIINLQMNTPISESYFGQDIVYPHYPFPSESIVAWWSNITPPVTSSTNQFIEWESYYSRTGNTYYLTGSSSNIEYTQNFIGGTVGRSKAAYHFGSYAFTDLNNIFTSSSTATIVLVGSTGVYSPGQNRKESWFGMTGDCDYYIGIQGNPNSWTIKRDEDGSAVQWFGNPNTAPLLMSFTYEGSTGEYSAYEVDFFGVTTATKAGASNRLGSTQQLRVGGWDTVGGTQLFTWFDCIVLDIKPTTTQLESWTALARNTYGRTYP
jgi:hypothetical protein